MSKRSVFILLMFLAVDLAGIIGYFSLNNNIDQRKGLKPLIIASGFEGFKFNVTFYSNSNYHGEIDFQHEQVGFDWTGNGTADYFWGDCLYGIIEVTLLNPGYVKFDIFDDEHGDLLASKQTTIVNKPLKVIVVTPYRKNWLFLLLFLI